MDEKTRDLLRLIERSGKNADADGWIKVSDTLWPLVKNGSPEELVDLNCSDQQCRLNEKGKTVLKWL